MTESHSALIIQVVKGHVGPLLLRQIHIVNHCPLGWLPSQDGYQQDEKMLFSGV